MQRVRSQGGILMCHICRASKVLEERKQYVCTGCTSVYLNEEDAELCEAVCDREEQ